MVGYGDGGLRVLSQSCLQVVFKLSPSCLKFISKLSQVDEEQWLVVGMVVRGRPQGCLQVVSKFSQVDEEQWLVLRVVV